ncbi:MAG: hypothetical protein AB8I08_10510 [Sandaracinaceae bacterium]
MERTQIRPEFLEPVADPAAVWASLEAVLDAHEGDCLGTVFRRHAVLRIRDRAAHFWSPHLYLELREPDEDDPDGTPVRLHGRFAPHPHVWTLFMAIYLLLTLGALASAVWGFSVWTLGEDPWVLFGIPTALIVQAAVYAAALFGQRLGADQMLELRSLVEQAHAAAAPIS